MGIDRDQRTVRSEDTLKPVDVNLVISNKTAKAVDTHQAIGENSPPAGHRIMLGKNSKMRRATPPLAKESTGNMPKTMTDNTGHQHLEPEEGYASFVLRHKRQYEKFVETHPFVLMKSAADGADSVTYAPGAHKLKPSANSYLIYEEVKCPFDMMVGAGKEVSTDQGEMQRVAEIGTAQAVTEEATLPTVPPPALVVLTAPNQGGGGRAHQQWRSHHHNSAKRIS
jgi:hypothetical protein